MHLVANVQIRDVPEELHEELRLRAAKEGMTLSDYLLRELTRMASRPTMAEVLARARARMTGTGGPTMEQIVESIREHRGPIPPPPIPPEQR